jgi:4-hydroxybenzoate polyprenyltransferase
MAHAAPLGEDAVVPPLPALLRAAHPVPAAAVTALAGTVIGVRADGPATAVVAIASVLAGQLSIGWSNDYLDRTDDAAAGRRDKPIPAGEIPAGAVGRAAGAAVVACVALSAVLGLAEALIMAAAVGSAWAYNAGVQATLLSWAPYAVSFGLAPVYIWVATDGALPPGWLVAGAALLGLAGHLTNVLPDLEPDRARGARGLPHLLGVRGSLALAAVSLTGAGAAVLLFGSPRVPAVVAASVAGACIVGVLVAGAAGHLRAAFLLTIAAAGAIVVSLLLGG